jgi:uncharacterized membrane protein YcgQ (UPF0703/DUF1980 family)
VLEWSALLRQTQDPAFYDGKPVEVIGFITPDPSGSSDIFYVSRFKITCCSDQGLAVMPASVDVVEEPSDPYLY